MNKFCGPTATPLELRNVDSDEGMITTVLFWLSLPSERSNPCPQAGRQQYGDR